MASEHMTPGQLAHAAYHFARVAGRTDWPDNWHLLADGARAAWEKVADSVRKKTLNELGITPGSLVAIRAALKDYDDYGEGGVYNSDVAPDTLVVIREALSRPSTPESA